MENNKNKWNKTRKDEWILKIRKKISISDKRRDNRILFQNMLWIIDTDIL